MKHIYLTPKIGFVKLVTDVITTSVPHEYGFDIQELFG